MDQKQEKRLRRGNTLITVIIFLLLPILALSIWTLYHKVVNPYSDSMIGIKILRVVSSSMEPTIKKNAHILVYNTRFEKLKIGDVVTFRQYDGNLNTHRIIAISEGVLTTQGDNSEYADGDGVTSNEYQYKHVLTANWTAKLYKPDNSANVGNIILYLVLIPLGFIVLIAIPVIFFKLKRRQREKEADDKSEKTATQTPTQQYNQQQLAQQQQQAQQQADQERAQQQQMAQQAAQEYAQQQHAAQEYAQQQQFAQQQATASQQYAVPSYNSNQVQQMPLGGDYSSSSIQPDLAQIQYQQQAQQPAAPSQSNWPANFAQQVIGDDYATTKSSLFPPTWREDIFAGVDFSDGTLNDPSLQNINLQQWMYYS